jgi:hypothetical protein
MAAAAQRPVTTVSRLVASRASFPVQASRRGLRVGCFDSRGFDIAVEVGEVDVDGRASAVAELVVWDAPLIDEPPQVTHGRPGPVFRYFREGNELPGLSHEPNVTGMGMD